MHAHARPIEGDATNNLMQSRGVGALFDVGMFDGKPLRELVERFVDRRS